MILLPRLQGLSFLNQLEVFNFHTYVIFTFGHDQVGHSLRSNEKTRKILSHQYLGAPGGGKTSFLYL